MTFKREVTIEDIHRGPIYCLFSHEGAYVRAVVRTDSITPRYYMDYSGEGLTTPEMKTIKDLWNKKIEGFL